MSEVLIAVENMGVALDTGTVVLLMSCLRTAGKQKIALELFNSCGLKTTSESLLEAFRVTFLKKV